MTTLEVLYEAKLAIMLIFFLSMPVVLAATTVGLVIALLQTVVQVQEQTLGFAAKFTAVVITIAVAGGWMSDQMLALMEQIFRKISLS